MCPYEVPKYSEERGIVRKCDMCHQRLAHGEAPACVQACPSEAIRITVVEQETVEERYRGGGGGEVFLPCSPDPAITLPTTRYISARPLPPDLIAGDTHETTLQPAHTPLVCMLVLTQLGAGGFGLLPVTSRAAQPALALTALVASLLGLAGSFLHLGRPQKAWRAFLGLRRSWLSREIVVFALFAPLAVATTIAVCLAVWNPLLVWTTAFVGILGVFCSGMTYHVTQREVWRGEFSLGRFLLTMVVLGSAAAWCAGAVSGADSVPFALLLAFATLIKLSRELALLRLCPDDAGLNDEIACRLAGAKRFF